MTDQALLKGVCMSTTGLFAGTALYITLVENPLGLQTGPYGQYYFALWRKTFGRVARIQASLAALSFLSGTATFVKGACPFHWFLPGAIMGLQLPYTLIFMIGTNNKLLSNEALSSSPEKKQGLLRRWGRLHLVRTLLSCTAFGIAVYANIVKKAAEKHQRS
eukprot:TRINITY_DN12048_c0_g3_i1.p1 TRINITY_DN12048_c0_g3~~TRINITY_DN12048_c0_g3_i1.p1  ORF type:complete len:162 (-),score=20.61 TRINITY_DN12048_c0_g3_i1:464-949(-)